MLASDKNKDSNRVRGSLEIDITKLMILILVRCHFLSQKIIRYAKNNMRIFISLKNLTFHASNLQIIITLMMDLVLKIIRFILLG